MNIFKKIGKAIHKACTHNRCDFCGLTKDPVYHIGGYISQCFKCSVKEEAEELRKQNLDND